MRVDSIGIARESANGWFAILKPNGRLSRRIWQSKYRAAEFAMLALKVDNWGALMDRGYRIVPSPTGPKVTH
jgi:hypothetical protein